MISIKNNGFLRRRQLIYFITFGFFIFFLMSRTSDWFDFSPANAATYTQFSYIINKKLYSSPAISKPAKGQSYTDPDFHTIVTRVTDTRSEGGGSNLQVPEYSRVSPVNTSNKYVILRGRNSYNLYDVQNNFAYVKKVPHISSRPIFGQAGFEPEYRWDYTGKFPNRVYYRYGMKLYQMDVETETNTLVHDFKKEFPDGDLIANDDKGDSSADSRYWAFMVFKIARPPDFLRILKIIVYDKQADKIIGQLDPFTLDSNYKGRPTFVDMSPNGDKVVVNDRWHDGTPGGYFDGPHAWNIDFSGTPVKIGDESKHSGWAFDVNGNEVWVQAWDSSDWISMTDVKTGEVTQIIYHGELSPNWTTGWHFGRMYNANHKGWIMMSTEDSKNDDWSDNKILMLELKSNPRIWMVAHSMSSETTNYWTQPHAAIDISGKNIYWGSNWKGESTIETYMVTLPSDWSSDLSKAP